MYVPTPINSIILAETVPQFFFEILGVRSKIKYASEFSTSACMNTMIESGTASKWPGTGNATRLEEVAEEVRIYSRIL